MGGGPARQIHIDADLARALLDEQHPDLSALALSELAEGWDNVIFRLGDELTMRLPRRVESALLVLNEQRWLPLLATDLPLPVPVPVRTGGPSEELGYPWAWSVGPWLPGAPAEESPPIDLLDAAHRLGAFMAAMHLPAPAEAPSNPYRGRPLADREALLHAGLDELGDAVDGTAVLDRWRVLVGTPAWPGPPVWLHGDLHPLNLLVTGGRLSAVIDFGDLCAGDPASDLAVAWMMFPPEAREVLRTVSGHDDDTWRRALGWAIALGVALANGDARVADIGRRSVLAALTDDL